FAREMNSTSTQIATTPSSAFQFGSHPSSSRTHEEISYEPSASTRNFYDSFQSSLWLLSRIIGAAFDTSSVGPNILEIYSLILVEVFLSATSCAFRLITQIEFSRGKTFFHPGGIVHPFSFR